MPPHTNTALAVAGPALLVHDRHRSTPTCADAILDVCAVLAANTEDRIVSIGDVIRAVGTYRTNTVYKTIQRLTANTDDNRCTTVLERIDRHRLRVP